MRNACDGLKNKLDTAEDRNSKLEGRSIEITKLKHKKEKKKKPRESKSHETIPNTLIGILKAGEGWRGREREKKRKRERAKNWAKERKNETEIFEKIVVKIFQN